MMINNKIATKHQVIAENDLSKFIRVLSDPELIKKVEHLIPEHRNRLYPPLQTLSLFMAQVLNTDSSCQNIVNEMNVYRVQQGLKTASSQTTAYCQARCALPLDLIKNLSHELHSHVMDQVPDQWTWMGKKVYLVDGTTVSMPDTQANQKQYPQHGNQEKGSGYPLARLVTVISLASGTLKNAEIGPYKGKETGEQALLRHMLSDIKQGDVLLGDAIYGSYFLLAYCHQQGIHVVFDQFGARQSNVDFRRGKHLGSKDHIVEYLKPKKKPEWMDQAAFNQLPEHISLRESKVGKKVLITNFLCAKTVPKKQLALLFQQRWHIELDLRNIKSTLSMDHLSCQSPEMIEKEIWVYFLAYNVLRLLMAQAAWNYNKHPRQMSFKHTLQLWLSWRLLNIKLIESTELLQLIAQVQVGNRSGRVEPRVVKKRPKPYPRMRGERAVYRESIQRYGHS